MERRRHYWNAKWGRIARRDILIFEDAGRWLVEAREGGEDGASRWFDVGDENGAFDLVRSLMSDSTDWRELSA